MRRMIQLFAIPLLALALAPPAAAQRRPMVSNANGTMLAQSCFACHGARGASISAPIPVIGGQSAAYLEKALKDFKNGARPATIMTRLMKAYSDAEMLAIAQYIAGQPFVRPEQATDRAKVELGARVYQRVCMDCHLNGGRASAAPDLPILAGQWLPYMQMTLSEITTGKRIVDEKFRAALGKLSKDELDAALHYFAAQR